MKKSIKLLLVAMVLFSISCNDDSDEPIIEAINQSSVSVMDETGNIVGSATLTRNKDGISAKFKTSGLIPENAYTMWFVIFGENPGKPISTFAAGQIVDGSGEAEFSGLKSIGDVYIDANDVNDARNFDNPLTAEVHIVVRTHGPAQPGMKASMIHTIEGGCESGFPSGPGLHPDSDVVGYCANVQVAEFPRPSN